MASLLHPVRRVNSCTAGRAWKPPTSPMPGACPSASDLTTFPAREDTVSPLTLGLAMSLVPVSGSWAQRVGGMVPWAALSCLGEARGHHCREQPQPVSWETHFSHQPRPPGPALTLTTQAAEPTHWGVSRKDIALRSRWFGDCLFCSKANGYIVSEPPQTQCVVAAPHCLPAPPSHPGQNPAGLS